MAQKNKTLKSSTTNNSSPLVSLYWDCQNVKVSQERAEFLQAFANEQGDVICQKAYSNWQRENKKYAKFLSGIGFQRINVPSLTRNSVDNQLIVDCIEEAYSNASANIFIIASGDGDFTSLGHVLKNKGKKVIIFAQQGGVSQSLIDIADESHIIERLDEISKLPSFRNPSLLNRALTHRSYINENPSAGEDNERLEFLGDAVLNFISGAFLYNYDPAMKMNESQLTRLRSKLVEGQQLAVFAKELDLAKKMRLGNGAIKEGGRKNSSLLSDTFEAVVGAYFLDSGIDAVITFIEPLLSSAIRDLCSTETTLDNSILVDSKGRFQEWALANFVENPEYFIIDESGLDHAKEFTAEVRVKGKVYGVGKGRRKQDAEKRAAEAALKKVEVE
ncbi:ribonuclease III [Coleofasciculus sp. E2-BRE-01]|uniref:ribonuclease III n=1 Tax=Coleofasciculus sp. E2-BRE-01 TaxID=3069524 RepID=UPI0032FE215E